MTIPTDNKRLTVNEVARILNISPRRVRDWCKQGKFTYEKLGGGFHKSGRRELRILESSLIEFMAKGKETKTDAS